MFASSASPIDYVFGNTGADEEWLLRQSGIDDMASLLDRSGSRQPEPELVGSL